jgi:bifunctional DNase/RNase
VIRLSLVGVRVEVPTNTPMVLLREDTTGGRYLPIFIGQPEATAIVFALNEMETPRPMTHDLFKNVLEGLAISLERIVITELREGTFYAELEMRDGAGAVHRISSRPSDAIALAVRFEQQVPIFANDEVLDDAGVVFEQEDEEEQVAEFREFLDQVQPEDFAT